MADEIEMDTEAAEGGEELGAEETAEAGGEEAATGGRPGKPAGEALAKRKIRVKTKTGGVEELELSDDEIGERLSLPHEAYKRMDQARREREELASEREKLKQERDALTAAQKSLAGDPQALRKFLREQAGDPEKAHRLLVQAMKAEIEELKLDPRDRRLAELEAEKQAREAADREAQEKTQKSEAEAKIKAEVEKQRPIFVQRLNGILSIPGVPQNDVSLGIAAEVYLANAKDGLQLTDAEMAEAVKDRTIGVVTTATAGWTGEDWKRHHPQAYKACLAQARKEVVQRQGGAAAGVVRQGPAVRKEQPRDKAGRYDADGRIPPPKPLTAKEEKEIFGA